MAKKKQTKKHKFKYAEPGTTVTTLEATTVTPGTQATTPSSKGRATAVVSRSNAYVGRDVRKVAILAAALIVVELILSYVFQHTSIGPSIYGQFHI
jgi:hypothetical protein